jgi:hypothetical protein
MAAHMVEALVFFGATGDLALQADLSRFAGLGATLLVESSAASEHS